MKRSLLFFFFVLATNCSVAQTITWDLTKKLSSNFKIPERRNTFRLYLGGNFQFFDNPFFNFSSKKHSVNSKFYSIGEGNFGFEYVSNIPIVKKITLLGGFYFSGTDFRYHFKQKNRSGLSFCCGFGTNLSQMSLGLGLNKSYQLGGRWYIDGSFIVVVSRTILDKSILDTLSWNRPERERSAKYMGHSMVILYPSKTPHLFSVKLKNKVLLTYYVAKRVGIQLAAVYKLGIPNKMFIYEFDYYKPYNRTHPDSHEKVVVSNSSFAWSLGLNINLWQR